MAIGFLDGLKTEALGLGVLNDVAALLLCQGFSPEVVDELYLRYAPRLTAAAWVQQLVVEPLDVARLEFPRDDAHHAEARSKAVPEAAQRLEPTLVDLAGESVGSFEEQWRSKDASVQRPVAVPQREKEAQLASPQMLRPEPLGLRRNVGPHRGGAAR